MGSAPVGDGHAFEAPLAPENLVEQVFVFGAVVAVDLVVGRHDGHGAAFPYHDFEGFEVNLPHGALVADDVYAAAVHLLVVEGEVLDAGGRAGVLDTFHVTGSQQGGQYGILAEVLIGTSTDRQALDVDRRAEDDVFSPAACFGAHADAVLVGEVFRPGGCQGGPGGEVGGGVRGPAGRHETVRNAFFADAERSVTVFDVLDVQARNAFGRHVGLAVEHFDFLFERQLGDDGVDFRVVAGQLLLGQGLRLAACKQNGQGKKNVTFFHGEGYFLQS